jgi:hypothetical protein
VRVLRRLCSCLGAALLQSNAQRVAIVEQSGCGVSDALERLADRACVYSIFVPVTRQQRISRAGESVRLQPRDTSAVLGQAAAEVSSHMHGPVGSSSLGALRQPPVSTKHPKSRSYCLELFSLRQTCTTTPYQPLNRSNMAGDPRALLRQVGRTLELSHMADN